ncbi:SCP-2 sterol transfer family protein [Micromonospora echinaurantiaca]|uniref:SCP-2 sterol transfer family protein n=1 Tax=Micromonospora echinaurantiaca TaxID=47857 RepID=A0A1C5IFD4_9ACTN|nr:SCP-2 sterol transfer family protein [Micromonospora echinaurantiaca]
MEITGDPTAEYFEAIRRHPHQPLLSNFKGTLRFEIESGDRVDKWRIEIRYGAVAISTDELEADSIIRSSRTLFNEIATGQENILASLLRGALTVEGDLQAVFLAGRLLALQPLRSGEPGSARSSR